MSNTRRSKALWEYLELAGVLNGSEAEIKEAKRTYRKKYFLAYKKRQRSKKPEFTICLSRENGEYKKLSDAAKKHHMAIPSFIKSSAFAYLQQVYLVPDRLLTAELEQLLADCLNEIKSITSIKEKYFWQRDEKIAAIEKRIEKLEGQINHLFANPPLASSNDSQNKIP